jgi:hypothetical protein
MGNWKNTFLSMKQLEESGSYGKTDRSPCDRLQCQNKARHDPGGGAEDGGRDVGAVSVELWVNGGDLERRERRHFKGQRKWSGPCRAGVICLSTFVPGGAVRSDVSFAIPRTVHANIPNHPFFLF